MAEHRQPEGRLGDEKIASDDLEAGAGGVGAALVVAGDDRAGAGMVQMDLRAAEDVASGVEREAGVTDGEGFAVSGRLAGADARLAIAAGHDAQCFGCGEDVAVAGAGVVGMAMGDDRAGDGVRGVDIGVGRCAVEALRAHFEPVFGVGGFVVCVHGGKVGRRARLANLQQFGESLQGFMSQIMRRKRERMAFQ
jgi:hypothetical protein